MIQIYTTNLKDILTDKKYKSIQGFYIIQISNNITKLGISKNIYNRMYSYKRNITSINEKYLNEFINDKKQLINEIQDIKCYVIDFSIFSYDYLRIIEKKAINLLYSKSYKRNGEYFNGNIEDIKNVFIKNDEVIIMDNYFSRLEVKKIIQNKHIYKLYSNELMQKYYIEIEGKLVSIERLNLIYNLFISQPS